MPGVFVTNFDLRSVLDAVLRDGAAIVPQALAKPFLRRLRRELLAVACYPAPTEVGPVRQELEVCVLRELACFPAAAELVGEFGVRVRTDGRNIQELATYAPNEVHVQRYRRGSLGITPHLDGKRYTCLVAAFTTQGWARFTVLRERRGGVVARFSMGPGSLVLLRGPGVGGLSDGRPFHAIAPVGCAERVSVTLRMNSREPAE